MANKRILVIDDDEAILELLQIVLGEEGYQVDVNNTGERIIDIVDGNAPDMILLDLQLPRKSGESIARSLKSSPKTRHIPVVMFSSHPEIKEIAREVKVDNYLSKPFDIDQLMHVVNMYSR